MFNLPTLAKIPTSTNELFKYCRAHPELSHYMPLRMPDRDFLLRVMATLDLSTLIKLNIEVLKIKYKVHDDLSEQTGVVKKKKDSDEEDNDVSDPGSMDDMISNLSLNDEKEKDELSDIDI